MDRDTVVAVIELLRNKKAEITRTGTPVAINKGKLLDELVMEVDALCPRPGYVRIPGTNGYVHVGDTHPVVDARPDQSDDPLQAVSGLFEKPADLNRQETTGVDSIRVELNRQKQFFPRNYLSHLIAAAHSPDAEHMKLIVQSSGMAYREVSMIDTRTGELVPA